MQVETILTQAGMLSEDWPSVALKSPNVITIINHHSSGLAAAHRPKSKLDGNNDVVLSRLGDNGGLSRVGRSGSGELAHH